MQRQQFTKKREYKKQKMTALARCVLRAGLSRSPLTQTPAVWLVACPQRVTCQTPKDTPHCQFPFAPCRKRPRACTSSSGSERDGSTRHAHPRIRLPIRKPGPHDAVTNVSASSAEPARPVFSTKSSLRCLQGRFCSRPGVDNTTRGCIDILQDAR